MNKPQAIPWCLENQGNGCIGWIYGSLTLMSAPLPHVYGNGRAPVALCNR